MPDRIGIVGVLVLYRRALEDSQTWKSVLAQIDGSLSDVSSIDFHLLIWDNSPPSTLEPPRLPPWAEYVGAAQNQGIAWPYNHGLEIAQARGAQWLLTLDQDTDLPPGYLSGLLTRIREVGPQPYVGAIVPQLVGKSGVVYSPVLATWKGEQRTALGFEGYAVSFRHAPEVQAFNSAALLRVSALRAIGGYDLRFWFNYLDHAVFHALHQAGFRIWIAGGLQVRHHLSFEDGRSEMSEDHFRHFSAASSAFRDLFSPWWQRALYTARLVLRLVRQKRRGDPAHFFRSTRAALLQRLFLSRRERLRRWQQELAPMLARPTLAVRSPAPYCAPENVIS